MDNNNIAIVKQVVGILKELGIYAAPLVIGITPDGESVHILVTPEAYRLYRDQWPYAAKVLKNIVFNAIPVYFHDNINDMQDLLHIYDFYDGAVMLESTVEKMFSVNPTEGEHVKKVLSEYIRSPRIKSRLISLGMSEDELWDSILRHRVIIGPFEHNKFINLETPITLNYTEDKDAKRLYSSLIHELSHLVDSLVGYGGTNTYHRTPDKLHELFTPRLFEPSEFFDVQQALGVDLNIIDSLSNDEKATIYAYISAIRNADSPEEVNSLTVRFQRWYEDNNIDAKLGVSFENLPLMPILNYYFSKYRTDEEEFLANANSIKFLLNLGLTKDEIEQIFKRNISIEDVPSEWFDYGRSLGWDRETAFRRLLDLVNRSNLVPFEQIWEYVNSPTREQELKDRGQLRLDIAGNWYKLYKDY